MFFFKIWPHFARVGKKETPCLTFWAVVWRWGRHVRLANGEGQFRGRGRTRERVVKGVCGGSVGRWFSWCEFWGMVSGKWTSCLSDEITNESLNGIYLFVAESLFVFIVWNLNVERLYELFNKFGANPSHELATCRNINKLFNFGICYLPSIKVHSKLN